MHIRIFHQYFRTPDTGGSLRSYLLARELVRNGFTVSVITATNEANAHSEILDGVNVYYLPVYYTNHLGFFSRVRAFLRFVWKAIKKDRSIGGANINYIISTPLTTGLIGLYGKAFSGTNYIFEVGDIWPEAPVQLNILKNPLLKAAARFLQKRVYQHARILVGLSPEISRHLESESHAKQILTITNFCDVKSLTCPIPKNEILKSLGLQKHEFIIAYTGTIGMANHLEYLADFASRIPPEWAVRIIIMGDGARKKDLEAYVQRSAVEDRIVFLDKGNRSEVARVLAIAHAVYISFDKAPVLKSGCPNKFFDAIAMGKLVIINFGGWLEELISGHRIGFGYDPSHPDEGVNKLSAYFDDDALEAVAERGMTLSEQFIVKEQIAPLVKELEGMQKAG